MKANNTIHSEKVAPHILVHPSVFTILVFPIEIMSGYITDTLTYLFLKGGSSNE